MSTEAPATMQQPWSCAKCNMRGEYPHLVTDDAARIWRAIEALHPDACEGRIYFGERRTISA